MDMGLGEEPKDSWEKFAQNFFKKFHEKNVHKLLPEDCMVKNVHNFSPKDSREKCAQIFAERFRGKKCAQNLPKDFMGKMCTNFCRKMSW